MWWRYDPPAAHSRCGRRGSHARLQGTLLLQQLHRRLGLVSRQRRLPGLAGSLSFADESRGLHELRRAGRLQLLAARGLDLLTTRGLDLLTTRRLDLLATRRQEIQAPRGQEIQAPRSQ